LLTYCGAGGWPGVFEDDGADSVGECDGVGFVDDVDVLARELTTDLEDGAANPQAPARGSGGRCGSPRAVGACRRVRVARCPDPRVPAGAGEGLPSESHPKPAAG
ncbi:MAG: hypothetical protein ACRCSP_01930, partial [Rhodoglobus sp.]